MKSLLVILSVLTFFTITPAMAQTVEVGWKAYDAGDYEKAKEIMLPLAEAGDTKAMNAIGIMHEEGKSYQQDHKQACDWYEKSAKAGYVSGQSNFGLCFENGGGRPLDATKALYWAEEAASQGDVNSQITLAVNLRETDREKAIYWGQKAVDAGSASARVAMWSAKLPHEGPQATYMDIACANVMIFWLGKPWDYCD